MFASVMSNKWSMGVQMSKRNKDCALGRAILAEHEDRIIRVPDGYFQPLEVVIHLSMMGIYPYEFEEGIDADVIEAHFRRLTIDTESYATPTCCWTEIP